MFCPTRNVPASVAQAEASEHSELLRLRGLVARLNSEARNSNQIRTIPHPTTPAPADPIDRIGPFELFTGNLLSPRHANDVKMMKLIGLALNRLNKDESLSTEVRALPFSDNNELQRALRKNIELPEENWNLLEILVPNLTTYSQLSDPGTIVARTKQPLAMPDGRWVRVYTRADGSVVNLIHDTPQRAIDFGELENSIPGNEPK